MQLYYEIGAFVLVTLYLSYIIIVCTFSLFIKLTNNVSVIIWLILYSSYNDENWTLRGGTIFSKVYWWPCFWVRTQIHQIHDLSLEELWPSPVFQLPSQLLQPPLLKHSLLPSTQSALKKSKVQLKLCLWKQIDFYG